MIAKNIKNLIRLVRISFILAKHDALFLLDELKVAPLVSKTAKLIALASRAGKGRPGERMVRAFYELGPTFIKLGQALSTRSDIFGDSVTADLSILQDKTKPFPHQEARAIIELELGKKIEELFSEFNNEPVAAASIAQVHEARDKEGNRVAVKVLRPGIEAAFAKDIELLFWLAALAKDRIPKRLRPRAVVQTFSESIKMELDLRFEAAAASELAQNFAFDSEFRIPKIDWQRTSRRVLTSEWIEGIPIYEKERLVAAGLDLNSITAKAAAAMFKQILRDGFFHADMHPGNLFIDSSGNIAAVDFGIMGRLSRDTRYYLAEMLHGFFRRDYRRVAQVHFDAGYVPKGQSVELFAQACRSIGEPILGLPQKDISVAKLLAQLFKITEDFQMETQPQLLLLQKTMMLTEGIGRSLTPGINMWSLTQPLIEEWAIENLGPRAHMLRVAEDLQYLGKNMHVFRDALDNLERNITPQGIRIHIDSLRLSEKKRTRDNKIIIGLLYVILFILAGILFFHIK